jgi:uncharacterized protein (TIGR02996 family)
VTTIADHLLEDVLADPADDAPRMILADWLEDQGQPERAEFIRVQCALARHRAALAAGPGAPYRHPDHLVFSRRQALERRERDLFAAADLNRWFPGPALGGFVFFLRPPASSSAADAPFAVVRRGFVESVTLTLAALLGGPCDTCRGAGRHEWWDRDSAQMTWAHCSVCKGTGRTTGCAAALFRAQPVTAVTLPDREPVPLGRVRFFWASDASVRGGSHPRSVLPAALHDALEGYHVEEYTRAGWKAYGTAVAAKAALSEACVRLGRRLAKLPEIEL